MPELLAEFSSSAYLTDTQLSRFKRIPVFVAPGPSVGLGLRTLTTIDEACRSVKAETLERIVD
jgi:hypothetical protein